MAVTRLKRKGRRNKVVAKGKVAQIQRLSATPVIKQVDVEELKAGFKSGAAKATKAPKEEAKAPEAAVVEAPAKKAAPKKKAAADAAPKKEAKTEDKPVAKKAAAKKPAAKKAAPKKEDKEEK